MNKKKLYEITQSNFLIVKDPIYQLISDLNDINYIYSNYKDDNKKIFYFSKEFFYKILYEAEKVINLNEEQDLSNFSNNLSELFYLSLLIIDNSQYDYTYSFNYINLIYNYLKENEKSIKLYKQLIIWKIIDYLIYNFKQFNETEEEEKKIDEIGNEIKNKIEKILILFNKDFNLEFSYNDFYQIKIDDIYAEIINSLIKNKKFIDYYYCYEIIKQINLDKINITERIYNKLIEVLNNKNDYMKEYIINNNEDLLNETKINFYYILIKFILKDTFYLYNIDFLYNNFINFKKILFKKPIETNLNDNNNIKNFIKLMELIEILEIPKQIIYEKNINNFDYILKDQSKSDSYIFKDKNNSSLNELYNLRELSRIKIENDFNRKFQESNSGLLDNISSKIELIDNKIENNRKIDINEIIEILTKLEFKLNIYIKENKKKYDYINIIYGKNNKKLSYINDLKIINNDIIYKNKSEEIIYKNYIKLLNFLKDIEEYIEKSNIKINNSEIIFQFKKEENKINKDNNKDIFYITCKYIFSFYYKNKKYKSIFKDENILIDSIDSKFQGFIYLINELSNEDYLTINEEINVYILE